MIVVSAESIMTFSEVAEGLPRRRRGRKTDISTIYRWSTTGCRGVVLETIQVGATRCTSRQALQRFFESLTSATGERRPSSTRTTSVAVGNRRSEAAEKKLLEMGA